MLTSSAKNKGRELQKRIVKIIMRKFPELEEGDATSTSMGNSGVDVQLSPKARRIFPISIEAKKTKATPSRAEIEQARRNAYGLTLPAVVWSPHGTGEGKELIMMDFNDFLDWYKEQVYEKNTASETR